MIKLTNAAKEHKGNALILNPRYIVSVFKGTDENKKPVTIIYGALQSSWNVSETVDQVFEKINELQK